MELYSGLKGLALTIAVGSSLYGCNTVNDKNQPTTPQEQAALETLVDSEPTLSITGVLKKSSKKSNTFNYNNYAKQSDMGAFDVEPITAPDFTAETRDGQKLNFQELAEKHKYVLLNFATHDCPVCLNMSPRMNRFYSENKEIKLITAVVDYKNGQWENYKKNLATNHTLIKDENGVISDEYGFGVVPSFAFAQKVRENGKDILKIISACNGGSVLTFNWLNSIEARVYGAIWDKEWEESAKSTENSKK